MANKKKVGSIKLELLQKSREAMLSAVEIYNNPNIQFKSETFTVLAIIAWTYLYHAYYKSKNINYHYRKQKGTRWYYDKTKHGATKAWELERCIDCKDNPLSAEVGSNLKFLIGLRHEIEHQMTSRIDDAVSAKFQACCLNYDAAVRKLFGDKYSIESMISVALQFASIAQPQYEQLKDIEGLPTFVSSFINEFEGGLDDATYQSPLYSYRLLFVPKAANNKGQADRVIEFVKADSEEAKELNAQYVMIKEKEKKKYLPIDIVNLMHDKGYPQFRMYDFTQFWKSVKGKENPQYGAMVAGDKWYWYEVFVKLVEEHCAEKYKQK